MEIGRTFSIDGVQYAIKKITGDRVDASKFKNGNLQRGRPCKFSYKQVAEALGESTEAVSIPSGFEVYIGQEDIDEPIKSTPDPAKIKSLIDSLGDDSSIDDWS